MVALVYLKLTVFGLIVLLVESYHRPPNRVQRDLSRGIAISNINEVTSKSLFFDLRTQTLEKSLSSSPSSSAQFQLFVDKDRPVTIDTPLSVVYNSSDIASYFVRNPALVVARVFQIASEALTIFIAGMDGMMQENLDSKPSKSFPSSVSSVTALRSSRVKLAAAVRDSMIRMGPTFIKLGQALSSRQDLIGLEGISQLQLLQDAIPSTFSTSEAKDIIRQDLMGQGLDSYGRNSMVDQLLDTLSTLPVAAASLGQVYRARINGVDVAVKVQRPHLREQVAADFLLARWGATFLTESGLLRSDGVGAVDEYASRLFEELDYINEANNLKKFAALYSENGTASTTLPSPGILVPTLFPALCSDRVLTMTWLEGEKLIRKDATVSASDLPLVQLGIQCTLSQILETGVLHADPHGGNLLKGPGGKLAYLDFGLVATVPISVREALVCSVVHLIERNYSALAREFDSLMLMPADALKVDLKAFEIALAEVAEQVLDFSPRHNAQMQSFAQQKQDQTSLDFAIAVGRIVPPEILPEQLLVTLSKGFRGFVKNPVLSMLIGFLSLLEMSTASSKSEEGDIKGGVNGGVNGEMIIEDDDDEDIATPIPRVKFDEIISALFAVATRFSFTVPPYFLNNVRAIGSLEGMALTADPNFSLLEVVYPYVLRKVIADFSGDPDNSKAAVRTDRSNVRAEGGESEYINLHDDTDSRLGSAAGQTAASGKTREVFRSLILRQDKETGLHLPRWNRLRRFLRDASRASMDVNMNSPLAAAGEGSEGEDTGATVAYVRKGSKMGDKQIAGICKQFLRSVGGRALLGEITFNIIKLWGGKIKKSFFSVFGRYRRQMGGLWGRGVSQPKTETSQARQ